MLTESRILHCKSSTLQLFVALISLLGPNLILNAAPAPPLVPLRVMISALQCIESIGGAHGKIMKGLIGELAENKPPYQSGHSTSKNGDQIPIFYRISQENITKIFTHNYDSSQPEKFGAKAIAVSIEGEEPTVFFFPTGQGTQAYNVHHRDVLATAVERELDRILTSEEGFQAQVAGPPDFRKMQNQLASARIDIATLLVPDGLPGKIKTRGLNQDITFRLRSSMIMNQSQGYQLTAERRAGKLVITRIDVDSSITSYQISSTIPPSLNFQSCLLDKTYARIEPSFIGFRRIYWPRKIRWLEDLPEISPGVYALPRGGHFLSPRYRPD